MRLDRSAELFAEALRYTPGGINTSLRSLPWPLVFERADGAYLYDADGNRYIDFHAAFGPVILGHRYEAVDRAVKQAIGTVDLVGAGTTVFEIELARRLTELIPSAERAILCNSGSEATYHAIRLARAVTGRAKVIKFQGCYHGWHDYLLMNVISTPEMVGRKDPLSAGMLPAALEETVVLPFNDLEAVDRAFAEHPGEIAAVILEPIPHNIGCVLPHEGFLSGLRQICSREGSLLVFDEVITGFRHALGGYQSIAEVVPDLTCLAKAMANGYPIAALCGPSHLMERFATAGGDVFFAGTYNGHPASCAAALATIETLEGGEIHRHTFALGEKARKGLESLLDEAGMPAVVSGFGSVFVVYFLEGPVDRYEDLVGHHVEADEAFRRGMVERGVFFLPTALKRNHVSASHTEADIDEMLNAAADVLKHLKRS